MFGYAKELELTYSDEELTERLADHFEKGIRHVFNEQQVKSKNTLFQILMDYDNDDKRAQNRKTNRDQDKSEIKSDERNEKTAQSQNRNQDQNPNKNKNQQRKPWQTRNINATQIQNKNKSSAQMSHDDSDNFGFEVEATSKSGN